MLPPRRQARSFFSMETFHRSSGGFLLTYKARIILRLHLSHYSLRVLGAPTVPYLENSSIAEGRAGKEATALLSERNSTAWQRAPFFPLALQAELSWDLLRAPGIFTRDIFELMARSLTDNFRGLNIKSHVPVIRFSMRPVSTERALPEFMLSWTERTSRL